MAPSGQCPIDIGTLAGHPRQDVKALFFNETADEQSNRPIAAEPKPAADFLLLLRRYWLKDAGVDSGEDEPRRIAEPDGRKIASRDLAEKRESGGPREHRPRHQAIEAAHHAAQHRIPIRHDPDMQGDHQRFPPPPGE